MAWGVDKGSVPSDTKTMEYVVQPGDTVWGIVNRYDKRDNLNDARDWVDEHNGLNGDIQPGEMLIIPIGR